MNSDARAAASAVVWPLALVLALICGLASRVLAREPSRPIEVQFSTPGAEVAGTLLVPTGPGPVPCVVIVGGSLSQTRDGGMTDRKAPARDALKRLAEELTRGNYASLRFDRVGYAQSKRRPAWQGTYHDEAEVAGAAIRFARARPEIGRVIAAAESAGVYMACLAAQAGVMADGYIFLGGLCGSSEEMYEYNFGRLVHYAESSPEHLAWVTEHARRDLAMGRQYKAMLAAAAAGQEEFEAVDGEFKTKLNLARRREELKSPPDQMFRYIRSPALVLAGAKDLNVPPSHAARAVERMREAGNSNAVSVLIPGADHSFQQPPEDGDAAFRERYTFESFKRPYASSVYQTILRWLHQVTVVE